MPTLQPDTVESLSESDFYYGNHPSWHPQEVLMNLQSSRLATSDRIKALSETPDFAHQSLAKDLQWRISYCYSLPQRTRVDKKYARRTREGNV